MTPLTGEQVAFFAEHGWLAIEEGAPPATVARLRACCDAILADPEGLAFDPTAQARAAAPGEDPDALPGPMLYSTAEADWLEWRDDPFHAWAHQAAEALLGVPVEYWCNQFTLKPPRVGGASYWHQDDGYVGAGEEPHQVACWLTSTTPIRRTAACSTRTAPTATDSFRRCCRRRPEARAWTGVPTRRGRDLLATGRRRPVSPREDPARRAAQPLWPLAPGVHSAVHRGRGAASSGARLRPRRLKGALTRPP